MCGPDVGQVLRLPFCWVVLRGNDKETSYVCTVVRNGSLRAAIPVLKVLWELIQKGGQTPECGLERV